MQHAWKFFDLDQLSTLNTGSLSLDTDLSQLWVEMTYPITRKKLDDLGCMFAILQWLVAVVLGFVDAEEQEFAKVPKFPWCNKQTLETLQSWQLFQSMWSESGIQGLLTIEPGEGDVKDFVDHHMDSWSISAMIFFPEALLIAIITWVFVLGWEVGIVGLYKCKICLYIFCSPPPGPKKNTCDSCKKFDNFYFCP